MTEEEKKAKFKEECVRCLSLEGLYYLRSYGRFLGLQYPTRLKKAELIRQIVGVLSGELAQERNNRGAPIKNDYISIEILDGIERIKNKYYPSVDKPQEEPVGQEAEPIEKECVSSKILVSVEELKEKYSLSPFKTEEQASNPVLLRLEVDLATLNENQKRLLNAFLRSI